HTHTGTHTHIYTYTHTHTAQLCPLHSDAFFFCTHCTHTHTHTHTHTRCICILFEVLTQYGFSCFVHVCACAIEVLSSGVITLANHVRPCVRVCVCVCVCVCVGVYA